MRRAQDRARSATIESRALGALKLASCARSAQRECAREAGRFFHSNMLNCLPERVFLRGVLLHYFNMKKTPAKSHRNVVEIYGEHGLAERTCQKWFTRFKSDDFGLEAEERPGQQKSLEMKNWKHYSMKIVAKHKKNSQNLWESLKQTFQNI